jgi:hypothetical protein
VEWIPGLQGRLAVFGIGSMTTAGGQSRFCFLLHTLSTEKPKERKASNDRYRALDA